MMLRLLHDQCSALNHSFKVFGILFGPISKKCLFRSRLNIQHECDFAALINTVIEKVHGMLHTLKYETSAE